jgi:chemotaxis phosphatase CheX-like protein
MRTLTERAQYFAEFQQYLVNAALDLFRGYGVAVEHSMGGADVSIQGPSVMAVIGYAAPSVRGALLLLTSRAVTATLQPIEIRSGPPDEASLRDVLGEFSNMLIGRVKNRLVTRDVAPLLSTPTTIFGDRLELPVPTSGMSAWHRFASPVGDIFARLDATFDAEFSLGQVEKTAPVPLAEGEMILF